MPTDPLKIGDTVELKSDTSVVGSVTRFDKDGNVTFATAYNEQVTHALSELNVKNQGFSAAFSGLGPNAAEIVENALGMMLVTRAYNKVFWNEEVMAFVVEDAVLEVIGKGYFEDWGVRVFSEISWPLTKTELDSYVPSSKELKAATNKTLQLTILDVLWRLFKKKPQMDKGRLINIVKVLAAVILGNVAENVGPTGIRLLSFR